MLFLSETYCKDFALELQTKFFFGAVNVEDDLDEWKSSCFSELIDLFVVVSSSRNSKATSLMLFHCVCSKNCSGWCTPAAGWFCEAKMRGMHTKIQADCLHGIVTLLIPAIQLREALLVFG